MPTRQQIALYLEDVETPVGKAFNLTIRCDTSFSTRQVINSFNDSNGNHSYPVAGRRLD